MSAHDELRRQLLGSVAARARPASEDADRRRVPRRSRGSRRGLLVVVLALAVGGGVAGATTQLLRQPGDGDRARQLVRRAIADTNTRKACQSAPTTLSDSAPAPEVAATFAPGRPTAAALRALTRRNSLARGVVVSRTIRFAAFPGGEQVLFYVSQGVGVFTPGDPDACDRARRARLRKLHPQHDAVGEVATELLAQRLVRAPAEQTVWLGVLRSAHGRVGLFHGYPVKPGHALDSHLSPARESREETVYFGVAVRGATSVRIASRRASVRRPIERSIAVRKGLVAFTLGPGTGPVVVRELAAEGRVLAIQTLRG